MARLRSGEVREISAAALAAAADEKRAKQRANREARQIGARRASYWRCLYLSAIDGRTNAHVEDVCPDDVKYFRRIGLSVTNVYTRQRERAELVEEHQELQRESESVRDQLKACASVQLEQIKQQIIDWLDENRSFVAQCELDDFFIHDKGVDWTDLPDLFLELMKLLKSDLTTADKARIRALIHLLEQFEDKEIEGDLEHQLTSQLRELEVEVLKIEADPDFTTEGSYEKLFEVSWSTFRIGQASAVEEEHSFTISGLAWLSSTSGQRSLREVETWLKIAAQSGKRTLKMPLVLMNSGKSRLEVAAFDSTARFRSEFELLTSLELLGFTAELGPSSITARW